MARIQIEVDGSLDWARTRPGAPSSDRTPFGCSANDPTKYLVEVLEPLVVMLLSPSIEVFPYGEDKSRSAADYYHPRQ
jgi:hypothetical protein